MTTLHLVVPVKLCLLMLSVATAQAGTLAEGAWSPSGCGVKPEAPALDFKNEKTYNLSVDAVNAYLQSLHVYIDCLVQEANVDIRTTTQAANAAQQAVAVEREKILAEVKAAEAKFSQ